MKVVCPESGHVGDLMQFVAEGDARKTMRLALSFPAPLADALVRYLQLFQPKQKALAWSRAHRLMAELHANIERGYVTRHGRDWSAPQDAWKTALQTTVSRRDELSLPLRDHAYLYEIICRGTNRHEAQAEQRREDTRRARANKPRSAKTPYDDPTLGAKPRGGSLKAALAEAQRATHSPTANGDDE